MLRRCTLLFVGLAVLAGCGSSASHNAGSATGSGAGGGALSAEAQSKATGDIPDNQNFLTFKNAAARYSITYPEGWAQTGSGRDVTFRDKNNIVHVAVSAGGAPTAASVRTELARERSRTPSLSAGAPQPIVLKGGRAIKVTYTTESAPNPVTGKRVKLTVDRYVIGSGGRLATIDLGTPVGVDNVDAYRMMSNSFRWL